MKKRLLILGLILLICTVPFISCNKTEADPADPADDVIVGEEKVNGTDSTESGNEDAPDAYVMDRTVANRVYSFYSESYGMIGVAFNKDGLPLFMDVYDYDLFPEAEYYSFMDMVYDDSGKLTELVFDEDSIIMPEATLSIDKYDDNGRPVSTKAIEGFVLNFKYDDEAGTVTLVFDEDEYLMTFDALGRIIYLKEGDDENKTMFEGNIGKYTETGCDEGEYYKLSYDDSGKLLSFTAVDEEVEAWVYSYTFGETGLCTSALYDEGEDDDKSKDYYTYDDKDRISTIESYEILADGSEEYLSLVSYKYNDNGQITEKKCHALTDEGEDYYPYTNTFEYNADGSVKKEYYVSYNSNMQKDREYTHTYYDTGMATKSIKDEMRYENGRLKWREVRGYSAEGFLLSEGITYYDETENITSISSVEYWEEPAGGKMLVKQTKMLTYLKDNSAGDSVIEEVNYVIEEVNYSDTGIKLNSAVTYYYANGNKKSEQIFEYYANGNKKTESFITYDESENPISHDIFDYDENGNRID